MTTTPITETENSIAARIMRLAIAQFRKEVEGSEQYADWEIVAIISSAS